MLQGDSLTVLSHRTLVECRRRIFYVVDDGIEAVGPPVSSYMATCYLERASARWTPAKTDREHHMLVSRTTAELLGRR